MADQSMYRVLPYHFRSIGNKLGTIYNILSAPPIEITQLKFNNHTKIKAKIAGDIIETSTRNYNEYPIIGRLLDGECEGIILSEVIAHANHLEFVFSGKSQDASKTNNGSVGRIEVEACSGLSLELLAREFAGEPERRAFCKYFDDLFLDRFSVEIIEYDQTRGVCGGIFYPKAGPELFEHLAQRK